MSGLLGKKRRVQLSAEVLLAEDSNVMPLVEDELTIKFGGNRACFFRLFWHGVPEVAELKRNPDGHVRAKRTAWVRHIYTAFTSLDANSKSGCTYFEELARYIRWIDNRPDKTDADDYFSELLLQSYNHHLRALYTRNVASRKTVSQKKTSLRSVLKLVGKTELAKRCLTRVKNQKIKPTESQGSEYIRLLKELLRIYKQYVDCYLADERPEICPAYGDHVLSEQDLAMARRTMNKLSIENQLTSIALLVYISYTGSNLSSALNIRRDDISFTPDVKGGYRLSTIKSRQGFSKQEQGIGFTKRAYEFFVGWVQISERMNTGSDSRLFVFRDKAGKPAEHTNYHSRPHLHISPILQKRGFVHIHARMLRASRSDITQRAFEDWTVTARAGNHSVNTVRKHYSEGNQEQNKLSISAGFRVMYDMAGARPKGESVAEHTQIIGNIFSSEEWKARRDSLTSINTPAGARCKEPFGSRAKTSLRPLRKLESADHAPCIDYLECFECPSHVLVAEVEDMWLMLSFRDSIMETLSRPSVNSNPTEKVDKLLSKIDMILRRFREKYSAKYAEAIEKNNIEPHPVHAGTFFAENFMR